MENYTTWADRFGDSAGLLLQRLTVYLPSILAALAVLLVGWLLARMLKALTIRLMAGADRLWHRLAVEGGLPETAARRPARRVVANLVFWLVMLFFITAAADILGIAVFADWLSQLVAYLPTLIAGALILLGGALMANLSRDLSQAAAESAGLSQGELIGRAVQIAILSVAVLIGAEQIGIQVSFLASLFIVLVSALFGGAALAFGFGARGFVRNLIAARTLRQQYQVGQRLRLSEFEGTLLEITPTAVILETAEGECSIPAGLFDEQVAVRVTEAVDDESA